MDDENNPNSQEPHEIKLDNLSPPTPVQQVQTPAPTTPPPTPTVEPAPTPEAGYKLPNEAITEGPTDNKTKKYLIIAGVAIAFITIIYFVYSFFFSASPEATPAETTTPPTLNTLSSETPEATDPNKELESIVNDLKDTYTEDSAPPSVSIEIPPETSETPATSEKVER